jgi:hypothetical protein
LTLLNLREPSDRRYDGPVESSLVDLDLWSDGSDEEHIAEAAIKRTPRAAAGPWPQLAQVLGTLDGAAVGERERWAEHRQLLDRVQHRCLFPWRQQGKFFRCGWMEPRFPHDAGL